MEDGRMQVTGQMIRQKPDLRPIGESLARRIAEWYQNPENERAYQEWKNGRQKSA